MVLENLFEAHCRLPHKSQEQEKNRNHRQHVNEGGKHPVRFGEGSKQHIDTFKMVFLIIPWGPVP